MSFLLPAALAIAVALPAAILIMHLLRGSRQRLRVPATFLWADFPPAMSGRERRTPPISLLLLLQLAVAVALGLALARPAMTASSPPRHIAFVLDVSASMQAADVQPSRFEAARAQAMQRLASLGAGDTVSLIRAGAKPELLASGDLDRARGALAGVQPGGGISALREAIALASQQIAATPDRPGEILVFTDGAFPGLESPGALAAPVEFVPVGGNAGGGNQAIVDVQLRQQPTGGGMEVYVEVANYDAQPVSVPVRVTAADSGDVLESPTVELSPRGTGYFVMPLPTDVSRLNVQLEERPHDSLTLDDAAEVIVPPTFERPRNVALVSASPSTLQRALEAIPSVRLSILTPSGFDSSTATPDLIIFDSFVPARVPSGPLLIVNPPAENEFVPASTTLQVGDATSFDAASVLLNGVDIASLRFDLSSSLKLPDWARAVAESPRGPLILDGHRDGRPVVVFGFDPLRSGMDKSIAFPLLVSNAVAHLLADGRGPAISPGTTLSLPVPASGRAIMVRPDGQRERLSPQGNELRIVDTDQTGRYTVLDGADERQVLRTFSVNMLDVVESDILPRRDLDVLAPSLTQAPLADDRARSILDEWWRVLVVIAFALFGIEWLIFSRRG